MSAQIVVALDGRARVVVEGERGRGDMAPLYALRAVVERNTPHDCDRTHAENLRDVLDLAARELRGVHVYKARFADGTEVFFTAGRLPAYVSLPAALRAAGYRSEEARA